MSRCEQCHARIPVGRNFCHPHYLEALRQYERALVRYQEERQIWERLPLDEKHQRNLDAEAIEVTFYTFFTALGLGGLAWYGAYHFYPIDGLIGIALLMAITAACIHSAPLRTPVGRLTRALVKAAPGVFSCALICLALTLVSDWVARHWKVIATILEGIVVALSLLRELLGQYRSTGEPQMPVEPRP